MLRRPLEGEQVFLDCGRRTTQLMRDSLGVTADIMRRTTIAIMTVAACGRAHQSHSSAAPAPRPLPDLRVGVLNAIRYNHEEPALLSALFRQLAQLADTGSAEITVYCLAVGSKELGDSEPDASPEVLERLRDLPLPAKPRTACSLLPLRARRTTVIDKNTKGRAMILRIAGLYTNDSTSTLTAMMDFYIGPLWAAGWGCLASKNQEEWQISHCRRMWVS